MSIMYISTYKELEVWKRAMQLVKEIYHCTDVMPQAELYGLVSQMRRCSISIPSNIAEGYKRKNLGDYVRFLCIADASAAELETQLLLTEDLYPKIQIKQSFALLDEVQRMLTVIIRKLSAKRSTLNAQRSL